ncbi:arrestin domain-containing protein 2-like isoform X2 [Anopheles stephensi]|uniref:arrestin domain-containing protein 2-like isoform X2 n=1 Tax=Anopheles stephensi TaxID=30069 RepID=UPI0016588349|nr:arrestin domain-containing protein 2-like isoform X2 [Anopheles stephensi]
MQGVQYGAGNTKIEEITLRIIGYTSVEWSEKRGQGKRRRTVFYSARRDHLSSQKVLFRPQQNGNPADLPAGEHIYQFACELPSSLPTSFEGTYGHCRYTAQVVLDRPWKFNLTHKVGFTVVQPRDLNLQSPSIRIPSRMEDARVFCCGIWRTQPLFVRLTVPCTGYVPGQAIPLTIDLDNRSTRLIEGVNMKLQQEVIYRAESPSPKFRRQVHTVVKHIGDGVEGESTRQYVQRLVVPTVVPTCGDQNLISVAYRLHLTVRVEGCGSDPVLEIPLIIGTTPLIPEQPATVAIPPPTVAADGASAEAGGFNFGNVPEQLPSASGVMRQSTLPPEYLPPPTYEEAMNAAAVVITDDTDTHAIGSTKPYVPLYPSYNFNDIQWPPLPPDARLPQLPLPPKQ